MLCGAALVAHCARCPSSSVVERASSGVLSPAEGETLHPQEATADLYRSKMAVFLRMHEDSVQYRRLMGDGSGTASPQ